MLGSGQVTVTIRSITDMSDRANLYKAVSWAGDWAATGRGAAGILIAGASSGQNVTVLMVGRSKFFNGVVVMSFGNAMTVTASGLFIAAAASTHEIGTCMGANGADGTNVGCGAWGAGIFNFANKPYEIPLSGGAFIGP